MPSVLIQCPQDLHGERDYGDENLNFGIIMENP